MGSDIRFAFFDVDDTLIRIKSMFDFFRFWALEVHGDPEMLESFERDFAPMRSENASREVLNRAYYKYFAGVRLSELELAGEAWATDWLQYPSRLFIPESCAELRRLQANDVVPVFVSGSFEAVLAPLAKELDVAHILASQLQTNALGACTGELSGYQTIGEGKAGAIGEFLTSQHAKASDCLAFGDDISDFPMLDCVGHPRVVGEGTPLATRALSKNWSILQISEDPDAVPTVSQLG